MRETCEFRVVEKFAPMLFASNEGKRLGDTIRKILLDTSDSRFQEVGRVQRETVTRLGRSFFHGWKLTRRYTPAEMAAAACLRLLTKTAFEPAGQQCGTQYDELDACSHIFYPAYTFEVSGHSGKVPAATCGVGARQVTDLFLNWRRIPKSKDISRTIAGEIVVSARFVNVFRQHSMSGVIFKPIRLRSKSAELSKDWFQMLVPSAEAEVVKPTRAGIDPFNEDAKGTYRCPLGHVIGLNLLSELSVTFATKIPEDFTCTRQFTGTRQGLLRPHQEIIISPRAWHLLESENLTGCEVEVVHVV